MPWPCAIVIACLMGTLFTAGTVSHHRRPTYGFFGLGLALCFASQAQDLLWPLVAVAARLVMAAGGLAGHPLVWGGLPALFTAIAVALVAYGTMVAGAVKAGAWREATARFPKSASVLVKHVAPGEDGPQKVQRH
jgi:Flp pilus assembly pilin Flp